MFYCNGTNWIGIPAGAGGLGCVLDGVVVDDGNSFDFHSAQNHANCASVRTARACTNGTLGGNATYQYASCAGIVSDTTPDAFSFNDVINAALNTATTPTPTTITISGISASTPVSVTGESSARISINGGSWVTSGNIINGQSLAVRMTSANTYNITRSATITVGGVTDIWTVTTVADACMIGPIGTPCADGAVYAGNHYGVHLFAAPADEGSYPWNNGTSDMSVITRTSRDKGFENTNQLVAQTDPGAPYAAAVACRARGPDWYLPAMEEYDTLRESQSILGGYNLSSRYWSSTTDQDQWPDFVEIGSLATGSTNRHVAYPIRCIRQGPRVTVPPVWVTESLPNGKVGVPYQASLKATHDSGAYVFLLTMTPTSWMNQGFPIDGQPNSQMFLSAEMFGMPEAPIPIGTPAAPGSYTVEALVQSNEYTVAFKTFTILVVP